MAKDTILCRYLNAKIYIRLAFNPDSLKIVTENDILQVSLPGFINSKSMKKTDSFEVRALSQDQKYLISDTKLGL